MNMEMETIKFFEALYGKCPGGWLTIWTLPDKKTYWFEVSEYEEAAEMSLLLAHKEHDVYFGVGLRKEQQGTTQRGSKEDVAILPGVWMDIDIRSDAHKEKRLPPDLEAALQIIDEFPFEPSILVSSGHGLHSYWLFKEPWIIRTEEERKEAIHYLQEFQGTFLQYALNFGWKLDNTSDLSRVLRVPGTINYKGEPKDVQILNRQLTALPRYKPEQLKKYFNPPLRPQTRRQEKSRKQLAGGKKFPPAKIEPIMGKCSWMAHCHDEAETLPEPEWYAMLSILGRCKDGEELAHQWSRPYSGYNEAETAKKLDQAMEAAGPVTCQKVWDLTGGVYCKGCDLWGKITSPINIGTPKTKKPQLKVIEGGGNPATFEDEEENELLDQYLENPPTTGLYKPEKYHINMKGIWKISNDDKIKIFPVPVIISKRMKNVDTGDEKIELSYYRDRRWNGIILERNDAMNRNNLVKLANTSLPVHSENAKALVQYLGDFDAANLDMPYVRSISHMGWVDGDYDRFLPGADEGIEMDAEGVLVRGFKEQGTLEEWVENVRPVLDFEIARFMLASSFASPLLRVIGHRNFLVYPYGGTRGGKTAALKTALSVWGDPEKIMTTFNSTRNALERRAAFFSDLPMGIDERQVVGDQQGFVESIAYMLGNGQSRGRAKRDGGLQEEHTWHNIALATGEDPLSDDSSSGGVKSRTLEIYGRPIDNEEIASRMHEVSEENYGVAGPVFIRKVIEAIKRNKDHFKNEFKALRDALKKECPENIDSHISAVAVVILGDVYANAWLFGKDEKLALKEAIDLGKWILDKLEKKSDTDDAQRAYNAFLSWYSVHEGYFNLDSNSREVYGWVDSGVINIYPTVFKSVMKELGFHDLRIRNDWAQRKWIETVVEGGKVRSTPRKWNPKRRKQERVVAVIAPDEEDED